MKATATAALALSGFVQVHAAAQGRPNYENPVLWNDLADLDVSRVGDTYYYSASTMAFSPGAPLLTSKDLVNWEYIGHSVPRLDFGDPEAYSLDDGKQAYVRGVWASSMRYRPTDDTWYWIGCVDFDNTYIYTASSPKSEWSLAKKIDTCYYDCGLLFDGDDIYVAYGNTNISVAQLNQDLTQMQTQNVFNGSFYIEGSRLYKIDDTYYILNTEPANAEWALKSSGGIFGPYEQKVFVENPKSAIPGPGYAHQGGIVDTPDGRWFYMAFDDAYPGGRVPMLAPMHFDKQGWPKLNSNQDFSGKYRYPSKPVPVPGVTGKDTFPGPTLSPQYEWNHNPDESAYAFASGGGLILKTATVTKDIFHAKNTLTKRILGPSSAGTVELDVRKMKAGDRAGLALFRDNMAYISYQDNKISLWRNLSLGAGWNTISDGFVEDSVHVGKKCESIYFRLHANIAPESDKLGTFYYSTDGEQFTQLGTPYEMNTTYYFFIGYRYGIFNFANRELGGSVTVKSFEQTAG